MRTHVVDTREHDKIACFSIAYMEKQNLESELLSAITSASIPSHHRGSMFQVLPCHIKNEKLGRDFHYSRWRDILWESTLCYCVSLCRLYASIFLYSNIITRPQKGMIQSFQKPPTWSKIYMSVSWYKIQCEVKPYIFMSTTSSNVINVVSNLDFMNTENYHFDL